jgi:hypothetical protein
MVEFTRQDRGASKNFRKEWEEKSRITFPDSNRVINITTSKNSRGALTTSASVCHINGDFESHMLYQDFSETVKLSQPGRVTEKVVTEQHAGVMAKVNEIIDKVAAYYLKSQED